MDNMKKSNKRQGLKALGLMFLVWIIIEFDFICVLPIPQILAMVISLIVWCIGAVSVMLHIRKQNLESTYYRKKSLTEKDYMILFFAIMGGLAIAVSNYLYIGLKPLFVRELLSGYPLYTMRNIIYYPIEVLLMLELMICSQRAGEFLTKKTSIPWGAIALFLLWGLPHLYHGFGDGIVSALRSFIYCIPFYASNKNIKTSYICMLVLWFL